MNQLRTAVVGVKGVGRGHLQSIREHARTDLVAVADLDAAAARAAVGDTSARAYADFDALLASETDLDAVVLATPHHLHAPMALAALERGLHVYVEKPIATRISDADSLVATAAQAGRILAVGHQYRTYRGNLRLKQLVDSGAIGDVQRVVWQWLELRAEAYYTRDRWRCTWEHAGGGVLLNQASHDIDLICWLFGPPAEVTAVVGNRGHQHEVEDTAIATVRFHSGVIASLQFSTWDRCLNYRQIAGERGSILFQDERNANVPGAPDLFRLVRYEHPSRGHDCWRRTARGTARPKLGRRRLCRRRFADPVRQLRDGGPRRWDADHGRCQCPRDDGADLRDPTGRVAAAGGHLSGGPRCF